MEKSDTHTSSIINHDLVEYEPTYEIFKLFGLTPDCDFEILEGNQYYVKRIRRFYYVGRKPIEPAPCLCGCGATVFLKLCIAGFESSTGIKLDIGEQSLVFTAKFGKYYIHDILESPYHKGVATGFYEIAFENDLFSWEPGP